MVREWEEELAGEAWDDLTMILSGQKARRPVGAACVGAAQAVRAGGGTVTHSVRLDIHAPALHVVATPYPRAPKVRHAD